MRIAENINIQPEKLSSGFSAALRICKKINGSQDQRDVIDFSRARFVTPTFVMPLLVYIKKSAKGISIDHTDGYLNSICFDRLGVSSGVMRKSEFAAYLEQFSRKRYIPLISFPAASDRVEDKNSIVSVVESIIIRQSGLKRKPRRKRPATPLRSDKYQPRPSLRRQK